MKEYQIRLIREFGELTERADKLATFIDSTQFSSLSENDQFLLTLQLSAMSQYLLVLAERLKGVPQKEPRLVGDPLRQADVLSMSSVEYMIHAVKKEVESMGADTRLTSALVSLDVAQGYVADWIDGVQNQVPVPDNVDGRV